MEEEYNAGLMVVDMKVIGKMIKQILKEFFFMLMEIYTKENGLTIKHMELEYTLIQMELNMKVHGKKINKMEKVIYNSIKLNQ